MGDFLLFLIAALASCVKPLMIMLSGWVLTKLDDKKRDFTPAFYAAAFVVLYLQL